MTRKNAILYVNGQRHEVQGDEHFLMLAEWLRKQKQLTGTKIVCAEGDCGACTVLKASSDSSKRTPFIAINSCIAMVGQMDGCSLVTVEGMAVDDVPSPAQQAMTSCHGSQCGYCTPGFVMAITGMLEANAACDPKTSANYLTGNLCRCTGYQPILDAAASVKPSKAHALAPRYLTPTIIQDLKKSTKSSLHVISQARGLQFFAPTSLKEATTIAKKHAKHLRIIGAATDLGVQYNKGKDIHAVLMSLHLIKELNDITVKSGRVTAGAKASLSELRRVCEKAAPEFSRLLNIFASPQIKNTATLVGNVANASPIGDTMPYLMTANADVHIASWSGAKIVKKAIPLTAFYKGYKQLLLKPGEIITHISFEVTPKNHFVRAYKTSARKDLDISAVSVAFNFKVSTTKQISKIADARIALGGVAATPIRAPKIEKQLIGLPLNEQTLRSAALELATSIAPLSDARASATYRRVLVENLFHRFSREIMTSSSVGGNHA